MRSLVSPRSALRIVQAEIVAAVTGFDLILILAVAALCWFIWRYITWAEDYEDRREQRHLERMRRAREALDQAPRQMYVPSEWTVEREES